MALDIGAEVGQKMRSAIKAKLLELNCYVDDELPDYIMVMVANKRTKSQMREDLQLFLNNKTSTFVEWLYIVLKKLKEVTVTNPEVYKKTATKRKVEEIPNIPLKKEKKDKKTKIKEENNIEEKSLTDDLPINANKLAEQRKIIVMRENQQNPEVDNFDIPLLSEVNMSTEEELEDIEQKIKSVKSRLGLLVKDGDNEEPAIEKEQEKDKINKEKPKTSSKKERITFDNKDESPKRKSILERLGKRKSQDNIESSGSFSSDNKRPRIDLSELRKEVSKSSRDNKRKEGILSRLGVQSKVSVPVKENPKNKEKEEKKDEEEEEGEDEPVINREVASVVKIKPRIIPDGPQANKNLLLKAVAEAQRSIAQTPTVGGNKPDALYTKKYKEKLEESRKLPQTGKNKIKKILTATPSSSATTSGSDAEYVPKPVEIDEIPKYVPTQKNNNDDDMENGKIKIKYTNENKPSIKSRLDKKKSPSPIIFDKSTASVKNKSNIPDKLPIVHPPPSLKNKERCKYWPSCRQGDKCEFVHPTANCEMFPHCKFGDKCLYLHPSCKFGSSCTRRDCSYSHILLKSPRTPVTTKPTLQTCKYFPNCTNINCTFYHPKLCKFGQFCKNQPECNFTHAPTKSSLTWRSK